MKMVLFIIFALLSFYVLAAYQNAKEGKAVIVDVREESEIKEGMVDLAISFPLSKIENDSNWKNEFTQLTKGKVIYLYCRSGARSGKVKAILKDNKIESETLGGFMTLGSFLPTKKP